MPRLALIAAALVALMAGVSVGAREPAAPRRAAPPRAAPRTVTARAPHTLTAPAPARPAAVHGAGDRDLAAARKLSLTQLAGHAVILRFEGNPAPAYVGRALRDGRAAGVILFRDNATSPGATRTLTRGLQRAAHGRAIICTDQEGGAIRILAWGSPAPSQSAIATPAAARRAARAAARDLRRAGVNLNLAPVADRSGPGTVMRTRAFPGGTAKVARIVAAAVRGYRGTGVQPTIKHFPGLGAADANTDQARVTVRRSARVIGRADLPPFRAAIAAGAPAVMVSHALYPSLDRHAIASQSRTVVTDLLRHRLGFRGVAMTDSIEAFAVRSRMSVETAAVRSLRAGIDVVLTTGRGSHLRVVRALVSEARRRPAFRARLTRAAARVLALRHDLPRR